MKSLSNLLHHTPWWFLLTVGIVLVAGLALFATPYALIDLQKSGATPEENRAIKREVDLTFSDGAIGLARSVVKEMRDHAKDPQRREELDQALEEIDQARDSLREAGSEVARAKREAADNVTEAVKEATRAITDAQREAERALKAAGVSDEVINKRLAESLAAAKQAEVEVARVQPDMKAPPKPPVAPKAAKPGAALPPPPPMPVPGVPDAPDAKSEGSRLIIKSPHSDTPLLDIDVGKDGATVSVGGSDKPLPPEMRAQIRQRVQGDLWRVGVGAGLILIFVPLFILAIITKFFVDRSKVSQRLAEVKKQEAEFHRMSQQVTEAKLSALQAQVEPHFLYNTLASVQALTEVDPARANAMTGHLIQYLRNALPKMREGISTVGQEIELVRAYLNILQMRMGKRLTFDIAVPPELMEAPFPPLMLPSLVENAIKHGLEPQREGGEVRITASQVDGTLRLIVADTGRGFGETQGAGVGLANIRERLAAMYGDQAKLTMEANTPQGVIATIEVPVSGARLGAAASAASMAGNAASPAQPAEPRTATQRTLAAVGTAERMWRKGLSFTFFVLVIAAAVAAGLAIVGIISGALPVSLGDEGLSAPTGALIGSAGILLAFCVMVLALALVIAIIYGLGFVFAALAIFIPIVVLIALFPVLSPFVLLGLGIWWLVRRNRSDSAAAK